MSMENEIARVNKFALIVLSTIDFFLVVGYAREGLSGGISPIFSIVFVSCVVLKNGKV